MCAGSALVPPEPCEARAFTSEEGATFTTVSQPQTLLVVVAEPSEISSRLIADVGGRVDVSMGGSPRWTWRKRSGVP